jgi:hypothetical protein
LTGVKADQPTARPMIDVTREPRGRLKVAAFRRAVTVNEMARDLRASEFSDNAGGTA